MRHVARIADALDAVHHIARILVERVVHRRFVVGAAAVVVDAETAADVDVLKPRAHDLELGVYMRELVDRVLDAADVLQLAAGMAVHELQAVEHVALLQERVQVQDLADEQAELGFLAGGIPPAAGAVARELDAHADLRPHAVALRVLQNRVDFLEILHHRNDVAAELGGDDDRLDVAVVLEAVAHHHAVRRILGDRHDREQLGFGADLEAEAELLAVAVDLLDDQALLIDLDRETPPRSGSCSRSPRWRCRRLPRDGAAGARGCRRSG